MSIEIKHSLLSNNCLTDKPMLQKMSFLYNALEHGWTIKKRKNKYYFTKNHANKKEVFSDEYLTSFVMENIINNQST